MTSVPKSALTEHDSFANLTDDEKQSAREVLHWFEPQRRQLKIILRVFFSIAGCSWFFVFFDSLAAMPPEAKIAFKINQYQIYLILLTLWGYELKMQERRLSYLINLSATLHKPWYKLTRDDVESDGKFHYFAVLRPIPGKLSASLRSLGLLWLFIGGVLIQFLRQLFLVVV